MSHLGNRSNGIYFIQSGGGGGGGGGGTMVTSPIYSHENHEQLIN